MGKSFVIIILSFLFSVMMGFSQSGTVYDELSLQSKILKMERKFAVYLPPGYASSQRSYPVLYLLHGAGDDQTGWVQFGEVLFIADKAIKEGKATPMIIVMPDANTGRRGYFNDIKGDWAYEDFFFGEFLPEIEKRYRIRAEKKYRAIAGLSMGGGGSFMYALHRPDFFSAACPLSAYIGPLSLDDARRTFTRGQENKVSEAALSAYYKKHSALELVNSMPDSLKKSVRWYIDCGDDDFLYEGNSLIHIAMKKKEIPHEFRIRDGAHSWEYWRTALPDVLAFVSKGFHQY